MKKKMKSALKLKSNRHNKLSTVIDKQNNNSKVETT